MGKHREVDLAAHYYHEVLIHMHTTEFIVHEQVEFESTLYLTNSSQISVLQNEQCTNMCKYVTLAAT